MEGAASAYSAVYHFRDENLLSRFLEKIPHAQLVEPLRANEPLRNRYFPGFRITNTVPNNRQLMSAYKKEIVDRGNSKLASFLCAAWISQQPVLAQASLTTLGVHSDTPADANQWIGEVHEKLESQPPDESFQRLTRFLAPSFPSEDIHTFVSIISAGADWEELRKLVAEELLNASSAPVAIKQQVERDLQTAKTTLKTLEASAGEIELQLKSELCKLSQSLDAVMREHDEVATRLDRDDASVQTLTNQLEQIKAELERTQAARDAIKKERQKLSNAVARKREELSELQGSFEKRRKDITRCIERELLHVGELETSLQQVEQRILAEQTSARTTSASEETQPLPPVEMHPAERIAVEHPISESPKRLFIGIGRNAICYQAIQRTFRNAVVTFLRGRLSRLFPEDHVQRMKKTFAEDWEKAAQNAIRCREMLGTTTVIRDDYDLLGTNHFFGIFERFYDKLFTPEAGQPPELPRPVKARFLGHLKAIKDGRDPLSHPVEEEISFEEARHLLYAAQEILKWLGCANEAAELSALATQLSGEPEIFSLLRRLPSEDSIYLEFVGRDELLREVSGCFNNPDNKRCLLAGDGGKGKSAAAYRFVQNLPSAGGRFQLIVWLSAKKRRFREGIPTTVESPDFTTAGEAVDRLLLEYGATAQDMEKSSTEKKHLLFEYLNEFPAFIVADDIDTVLEDDEVVSLFTHDIPHTLSSVLLTSRRAIPGIRSFIVQGFDADESEEFVKSRIRLYGLNPASFTTAVIREIAKATDGSPLYMDDLMRLAKILDIHKAIRLWAEKGGDEARKYALQREIEQLTRDARKVLIAAAIMDDPISFTELESILESSEDRILSALTELQTLFLFPKAPIVEGEQRYEINLNTKKLVRLVLSSSEFYERIETRIKVVTGKLPAVGHSVVSSLIRQALLRFYADQHAEAEALLLRAIEKYPNAADLHGVLGYFYKRLSRIADARVQFEAAFKLKANKVDMYLHWQKMEISEKEWLKALSVADRGLKILPDAYEIVELRVNTLRQAGFDFLRGLHREKAVKMWTEAIEEVKRKIKSPETLPPGQRALNASMYYSIVVCLDMLNQFRERNHWLERWEKEHPDDPQVVAQKEYLTRKRGTLAVAAS